MWLNCESLTIDDKINLFGAEMLTIIIIIQSVPKFSAK